MKHQSVETPEIEALGEVAVSRTEQFFEKNGKRITVAIVALFIFAAAIFGYKELVMVPAESRAADAIYPSQVLLEGAAPNYEVALNGDGSSVGFLAVAQEYGSTKSGNLAHLYAAVCYMKLGDFESAEAQLTQYKKQKGSAGEIVYAQCLTLQGDVAVEQDDYTAAVALYKKAAAASENILTAPLALRKAGMAAQKSGDNVAAVELYESVINLYPASPESRTAEKYLGTIK